MSPKTPASAHPSAATTATQPAGICSIALLVEIGDVHDSGVARSSRAGMKRSVNAGPTARLWLSDSGKDPRSQTFLRPFLRSTVVNVAVDTFLKASITSAEYIANEMSSAG